MSVDQRGLSIVRGSVPPPPPGPGDDPLAWFESWLARDPGAPAVESEAETWTYGQVDALAHRVAGGLGGRVHRGDLVGVCLDRSALLVAVVLALARLGAAYLPLGLCPGRERLAMVTTEAPVACLLTNGAVEPPAGWLSEELTWLAGTDAEAPTLTAAVPPTTPRQTDERPFYAVLTSGSTGAPKAVAVGVPSFANLLRWYCARCDLRPGARVSLLIGVTFDPHLMEMWAALCSGATLCVAPDEVRTSPSALLDWLRDRRVTACILPTPLAELAFDLAWPPDLALEHLVVGGDRLRSWPPLLDRTQVHNMYGPAETTVVATAQRLEPRIEGTGGPVPIGRPIAGVEVQVTDAEGAPVPVGEPGELRVAGAALALGYLDAKLTGQRFETAAGVRVYRTGDRARMREDGVLEFLGRLDDQVKVAGVRVELAEVEAALERAPGVRQAVAAAVRSQAGDVRLVAFVRPSEPGSIDPSALLVSARSWLTEQAIPSSVQIVDEFPLTANGKVDRAALAAMAAKPDIPATGDSTGDREATVDALVTACRELLPFTAVTPDTNFLAAGGTSMGAARLLVMIEETWCTRLRAAEVLRQPNLRSLAELIDRSRSHSRS